MAKYDLSNEYDKKAASFKFQKLMEKGKYIDLTEKRQARTIQQNKYLHIVFGVIAMEYGLTMDETKQLMKVKFGEKYSKKSHEFVKSTADYNTLEMTIFIEKMRDFFAVEGLYIPSPDESTIINQVSRDMDKSKQYL